MLSFTYNHDVAPSLYECCTCKYNNNTLVCITYMTPSGCYAFACIDITSKMVLHLHVSCKQKMQLHLQNSPVLSVIILEFTSQEHIITNTAG